MVIGGMASRGISFLEVAMPNERLSMRACREILRLHFECGLSNRAVAGGLGLSPTTVSHCLVRAKLTGLGWPLPPDLDDATLEAKLYPPADATGRRIGDGGQL
jgi:hypothetical protein